MFKKKFANGLQLSQADYLLFRSCKTGQVELTQQVSCYMFKDSNSC
jgi:hypothetical protein